MSYNSDLQNNNTDLQDILQTVRSLPSGGGGGSWIDDYKYRTVVVDADYGYIADLYPAVVESVIKEGTESGFDRNYFWLIHIINPSDEYINGYRSNGIAYVIFTSATMGTFNISYIRNNTSQTIAINNTTIYYDNSTGLANRNIGISSGTTMVFYKIPLNR